MSERDWIEGNRAAYRRLMAECVRELDGKEARLPQLIAERDAVRAALRELCAEYGDNDWEDNLNLVDVIQKHLAPHLQDARSRYTERELRRES